MRRNPFIYKLLHRCGRYEFKHSAVCKINCDFQPVRIRIFQITDHAQQVSSTVIYIRFRFVEHRLCVFWGDSRERSSKSELFIIEAIGLTRNQ